MWYNQLSVLIFVKNSEWIVMCMRMVKWWKAPDRLFHLSMHNYLWRCRCHFHCWNTAFARWTIHPKWLYCRLLLILWHYCYWCYCCCCCCGYESHRMAFSHAVAYFCEIRVRAPTFDVDAVLGGRRRADRFPPVKSHALFESVLICLKYLMNEHKRE